MDSSVQTMDFRWEQVVALSAMCLAFEVLGLVLNIFVLLLSAIPCATNVNVGPRIFTVNMILVNVLDAVCGIYHDLSYLIPGFEELRFEPNMVPFLPNWADNLRNLTFLASTCSFVPMLVMTTLACYDPQRFNGSSVTAYFVALTFVSDAVPIISLAAGRSVSLTREFTFASLPYNVLSLSLFVSQLVLTVLALRLVYSKKAQLSTLTGKATNSASSTSLTHLLLFSIGPYITLVPFAVSQCTILIAHLELGFTLRPDLVLRFVVQIAFAAKPLVDSVFTLLFLGEYRRQLVAVVALFRRRVLKHQIHPAPNIHHTSTLNNVIVVTPAASRLLRHQEPPTA